MNNIIMLSITRTDDVTSPNTSHLTNPSPNLSPKCPKILQTQRADAAPTLATPLATTPTPTSDTSFTLMRATGLADLRS